MEDQTDKRDFEVDPHPCPMAVYEFSSKEELDKFCATGEPGNARRIG